MEMQVIARSSNVLEFEHPNTLTSMTTLASRYMDKARCKEAEGLEVQMVETGKRLLSLSIQTGRPA